MKTWTAKPEEIPQKWWVVDASGKTLGRLATEIASVLRGKNKPEYTPHVDTGDFVVVLNSEKIALKGKKMDQKKYYRHTGYFGSLKETTARELLAKKPEQLVTKAVTGMLPRNRLARQQIKKLKVYVGSEHPHEAQQPKPLEINSI